LLHLPYSIKYEENLSSEIKSWLSFANEKLKELDLISSIYFEGEESLKQDQKELLAQNRRATNLRSSSDLINSKDVQNRVKNLTKTDRSSPFKARVKKQKEALNLPILPTTTIGSFPQTTELRSARAKFKKDEIDYDSYKGVMRAYIDDCIAFQEEIGLDVLVHGEPERNDMVEYFGELMDGFAFSQNGWVKSYGSRCVKPPLIYGDVSRPNPMTVEWIKYSQSKLAKL
jgi:5-methyltetrahydropteroyltriglutamate--homocysteine methyltransferase